MIKKLCELRYGGVIVALAPEPEILLLEKSEMIFNSSVRYPDLLEIFFRDGTPWLFDEKMDKKRASRILYGGLLY